MSYCDCHSDHIIRKVPDGDTHERKICSVCSHIFYENPNIVTGVIPIFEDKILICKRAIQPRKNFWTVPSGFMEMNETLKEAALRECDEEAGVRPKITDLHTIYDLPHIGQVYMLFKGICDTDQHSPGIETIESKWVTYDQIPWDEIAFSSVTFALKHFFSNNLPCYGKFEK